MLVGGGGEQTPIGTIIPYGKKDDIPDGYLLCNGAEVSKVEYEDLYNAIGDTYGEATDSTCFVLPDLRDKTIWGGEIVDIGEVLEAGLPNIKGDITNIIRNSYGDGTSGATGAFKAQRTGSGIFNKSSSGETGTLSFDASQYTSIYSDDVDTVQPPAVVVVFLIKAYNTVSSTSVGDLINLDDTNIKVTYKDTFTIIYPNGGSEESPSNVINNTRYVEDNPFPGYAVNCIVEVFINNQWGSPGWYDDYYNSSSRGNGVKANQLDDDSIIVQTGSASVLSYPKLTGNPFGEEISLQSVPCRVKVYKIGKLNPDVPDLQEVTVTNVLEKPKTVTTVTYEDTFTIIYPNNGTESNPANVSTNTRYVEDNPFPGYIVNCAAEIQINGEWGQTGWWSDNSTAHGTAASQFDNDQIIIKTGYAAVVNMFSGESGAAFPTGSYTTSAPCRVKVWKVGKVDNSTPDLQEVSVHNTITVDEDQYMKNNFVVLYPNNGTVESPANITNNTRLIENNPFPGYYVHCVAEIFYNNQWGDPGWFTCYINGGNYSEGVRSSFNPTNNTVVVQSGTGALLDHEESTGAAFERVDDNYSTAPVRVVVWKVGKLPE